MSNDVAPSELLTVAHDLADAAGRAILPHFRETLAIDNKGGDHAFDPVTLADRAAEQAIATGLAARFPDHGMIGEEFGETNPAARYQWIVDPIDGTRSFIMGLPTWGTLIAVLDAGKPIVGLMDQPFTGERFYAAGKGAHLRHLGVAKSIRTRACDALEDAVVSSTHPDLFGTDRERHVLAAVKAKARMVRFGGDCYAYCMLAAGQIDAIVEPGLQIYDIAAIIPIVESAGGRITTWSGNSAANGGDIVATGDPRLHDEILALIERL